MDAEAGLLVGATMLLMAASFGCGENQAQTDGEAGSRQVDLVIRTESMYPTLPIGARVLVDTRAYERRAVAVDDIVVIAAPQGALQRRCRSPDDLLGGRRLCVESRGPATASRFVLRVVARGGDAPSLPTSVRRS